MRINVLSASYSATPKNIQVRLEFIPETEPEIFQLAPFLIGKTTTGTAFAQIQGQLTGTFIVSPSQ